MENINTKTLVGISIGAVVLGAAVYLLSRDDGQTLIEPKYKHTLSKLKKILDQCKLEYICIYARNYNIMMRQKENNEWSAEMLDNMQGMIEQEMDHKTGEVVKYQQKEDLCMEDLTVATLEAWIAYYKDTKEVKDQVASITKLHHDVFERQQVDHIDYSDEIPKEFTKEMYIATFTKIWATIRHDMWKQIQEAKKRLRVEKLEDKDFAVIYQEVHNQFESVRTDIYELLMNTEVANKEYTREIMQKAYVTYSTVTHIKDENGNTVRSRWADQVNVILKKHGEYVNQFADGVFYDSVKVDPRDSKDPDEKLDLGSLPQFKPGLSKKKTFLSGEGREVKSVSQGADKWVNKMIEIARAKKKEIRERKLAAGEEVDLEPT